MDVCRHLIVEDAAIFHKVRKDNAFINVVSNM